MKTKKIITKKHGTTLIKSLSHPVHQTRQSGNDWYTLPILEYCADAIALYQGKLVLVERLKEPLGYALPGGRYDRLESAVDCAVREFKEETGLILFIEGMVGTYDTPGRDPRGPKVSTVVYGTANGKMRDEEGKTRVFLLEPGRVDQYEKQFAFDHYTIIKDWQELIRKR